MSRTNSAITGNGKAIQAHKDNQSRPEAADHLPLKNSEGEPIGTDAETKDD